LAVDRLPPRSVRALIDEMDALPKAGASAPALTFHLVGGQTLRGRLVAQERGSLVLHLDERPGSLDVAYVSADAIAALVVHHTEATLPLLSGGRIARVPADAPGRLALQRRAEAIRSELARVVARPLELIVDWETIGASEGARAVCAETLEHTLAAITGVAADTIGREALAGLAAVEVRLGEQATVRIESERLVVEIRHTADQTFGMKFDEFERAFLAAL
jgi:hypothetical protein